MPYGHIANFLEQFFLPEKLSEHYQIVSLINKVARIIYLVPDLPFFGSISGTLGLKNQLQ